jgi:hypothetical protein
LQASMCMPVQEQRLGQSVMNAVSGHVITS